MMVELSSTQRDLLLQLVDAALREIGPEIRHTMTSAYKDDLKDQRRDLRSVRDLLTGTTSVGVSAPHFAPSGLIGTP